MSTINRQIRQTGVITEDFGSTITDVNHIDTYGCFPLGDTTMEAMEYDVLASYLAGAGVGEQGWGWGFEEADEEIQKPWIDGSPWLAYGEGEQLWRAVYDHEGWLHALAETSVQILEAGVVGEGIVHAVEFTGEVWSPREYNFTTDGYMARWTVDTDALEQWLTDNGIVIEDGRDVSGFIRTADDETWYLGRALREYLEHMLPDYTHDMQSWLAEAYVEDQYIEVEFTEAGRAWIEEYKRAT